MIGNYYTLDIMARSINQEKHDLARREQLSALARKIRKSSKNNG